jgi:hypothetical protein
MIRNPLLAALGGIGLLISVYFLFEQPFSFQKQQELKDLLVLYQVMTAAVGEESEENHIPARNSTFKLDSLLKITYKHLHLFLPDLLVALVSPTVQLHIAMGKYCQFSMTLKILAKSESILCWEYGELLQVLWDLAYFSAF